MRSRTQLAIRFLFLPVLLLVWLVGTSLLVQAKASAPQVGVSQLLLLKKLGYSEAQVRAVIKKAKRQGKFQLKPMQVLTLRKAGFSIPFIRWLGIASLQPKAAPTTPRPRARKRPVPRRTVFVYKLPWDRSQPTTKRPTKKRPKPSKPVATKHPQPRPTKRPAPRPRQQPTLRRNAPQPRAVQPTPARRIPKRPPPPRVIPPSPKVLRLIQLLRTGTSVQERRKAAHQLGTLGPKAMAALPHLVMTLRLPTLFKFQPVYPLQQTAIWAIGRMGPNAAKAVPFLLSVIRKPLLRSPAINALDRIFLEVSKTHPAQLITALQRMLRARWLEVRILALRHLGYLGKAAAQTTPHLLQALQVKKPLLQAQQVRKYAAIALGTSGVKSKAVFIALYRLYQDQAAGKAARHALIRLLGPAKAHAETFVEVLGQAQMPVSAKLDVLRRLAALPKEKRQQLVPVFARLLHPSQNIAVRDAATRALRRLGPAALPALLGLIEGLKIKKKTRTTTSFRRATIHAIGAIGHGAKAAVPALMQVLKSAPELIYSTEGALRRMIKTPLDHWPLLVKALQQKQNKLYAVFAAEQLLRVKLDPALQPASQAALQKLKQLQQTSGVPAAYWSWGAYELATIEARRKAWKAANQILQAAIAMGFDDHLVFATMPSWRPFLGTKMGKATITSIRSTPAAQHELLWLKQEIMTVHHETRMMLIQQIGRKDTGYTKIFQTRVPSHPTTSHAVIINRLFVRWLQQLQKVQVLQADISRKNHLLSMSIISNMGGNKGLYARQMALQMKMNSARLALVRARARLQSVKKRQYHQPPKLANTPIPAPFIKALPKTKASAQRMQKILAQRIQQQRKKKQYKKAERTASYALKLRPKAAQLWATRGNIRLKRKNYQGAIADFSQAIKLSPRTYWFYIQRGFAYYVQRNYKGCIKENSAALQVASQHKHRWLAHVNVAAGYVGLKQFKRALLEIRRAYQQQPHNALVLANLSYILLRLGHTKRAAQWIKKALMYNGKENFALYTKAAILAKMGNWGQALETLRFAYERGFQWTHMPPTEPAFMEIRKTPAFRTICGQ